MHVKHHLSCSPVEGALLLPSLLPLDNVHPMSVSVIAYGNVLRLQKVSTPANSVIAKIAKNGCIMAPVPSCSSYHDVDRAADVCYTLCHSDCAELRLGCGLDCRLCQLIQILSLLWTSTEMARS